MTKKFEVAKASFSKIVKGKDIHESATAQVIVAGLGVIPIAGNVIDAMSAGIGAKINKAYDERLAKVLEIILSDNKVTPDMVEDVEPIMAFAKMLNAVKRLLTNDKLKYFANLYKNLILEENRDYNQFEEYLKRLESLSHRELQVLFLLHKNELSYRDEAELLKERETQKKISEKEREGKGPNAPYIPECNEKSIEHYNQTIVRKWKRFNEEVIQTCNIDSDILQAFFLGISKSGFCMQFKEMEMPMNSERMYYVTKYYENFYKSVMK